MNTPPVKIIPRRQVVPTISEETTEKAFHELTRQIAKCSSALEDLRSSSHCSRIHVSRGEVIHASQGSPARAGCNERHAWDNTREAPPVTCRHRSSSNLECKPVSSWATVIFYLEHQGSKFQSYQNVYAMLPDHGDSMQT